LVGVAVNVTEVPVQTGFAEAAINTLTGRSGLTVRTPAALVVTQPPDVVVKTAWY
jgi:hypothetical protein